MWEALAWLFGVGGAAALLVGVGERFSSAPGDGWDRFAKLVFIAVFAGAGIFYIVAGWTHPSDCYGSGPTRVCEGE